MSEPESFLSDAHFTGTYCRLIETYRLEPTVLVEQFERIMKRVNAREKPGCQKKTNKRKTGESK